MNLSQEFESIKRFAVATPYDSTKSIGQYQHHYGDIVITFYMAEDNEFLSLSAKRFINNSERETILTNIGCEGFKNTYSGQPNKDWFVVRYQKNLPKPTGYEYKPREIVYKWGGNGFTSRPTSIPQPQPQPELRQRWQELPPNKCKRCHRELTDPFSIKTGLGPDCREHIEISEDLKKTAWEDITQAELNSLYAKYNIYDQRSHKSP